jgi:hypothetical protein
MLEAMLGTMHKEMLKGMLGMTLEATLGMVLGMARMSAGCLILVTTHNLKVTLMKQDGGAAMACQQSGGAE